MQSIRINVRLMFICICNAIRECDLRRLGSSTPGDAESLYALLGKRPQCRRCLEEADHILLEVRQRAPQPLMASA
jgi:bacterioferritin-associated ferredoxin